jgi:hypothetical protein
MNVRRIWIALFCLAVCTVGLADTLKLRDGTVLEGRIQEVGDKYWIKLTSGGTRLINKSDVVSKTIGDVKPVTPEASKTAPGSAARAAAPSAVTGGASFQFTKNKADRVDAPVKAVQLWENFIAKNPSSSDLAAAKGELEKWDALKKDNA